MTSLTATRVEATGPAPLKRKIAAILAADVAGYSRLVAEAEERTLTDLAAAREIFDARVVAGGGRVFNTAGDSVMCEFDSAVEALRAAVDIQEAFRLRSGAVDPRHRLEFRMGLTIGDVVERGGDLLGDGVNIAARLEGLAPPGGICVSRSVHEAVANKLPVTFRELGARQLKNIPLPVYAYLVMLPGAGSGAPEPLVLRKQAAPRERSPLAARAGRGLAIAAVVLLGVFAGPPAAKYIRTTVDTYRAETPVPGASRPDPASPGAGGTGATPPASPAPSRPTKAAEKPADRPQPAPARQAAKEAPKETSKPEAGRADPPKVAPDRSLPADPAAAFATLAREGVLADARSAAEHYHNARVHEAKGDRNAALAAYAAAAPLAAEAVDLHIRYGALLRATKGIAAVRQTLGALAKAAPAGAAAMTVAFSAEGEERRSRVEAFAAANPDLAVADYLLSASLNDNRDGGPTLTERRLAFDAAERFLDAAANGQLDRHFIDRTFLEGWLDGARRQRGEIQAFFSSAKARPNAAFTRTGSAWLARLVLPEPATAVSVRLGERGELTSTGFLRSADPRTGKPLPNLEVELPAGTGRSTLYVGYVDRSGRAAGPFPIPFDPSTANAEAGRAVLERYPDSWVSFRTDIPDLLSFAGLVSNRCAISRATIGYGDEPPRDLLPLPGCDATGPATMPGGPALVRLPDGTDTVQIQLTYADGSESQVRTFRRP